MQFESWQAFWNMGGYALYVWLSFGVTTFCLAMMVFVTRRAHRKVLNLIVKERSRRARIQKNVARTTVVSSQ